MMKNNTKNNQQNFHKGTPFNKTFSESSKCFCDLHFSQKDLRNKGIALVWTVILMMLIILLIGLSLDTAKVALVMHQLHNAADAAALAGGPWVKKDQSQARILAQAMAAENTADANAVLLDLNENNDPNGDIIVGRYTYDPYTEKSYFTPFDPLSPDPIPVNALAVIASRDVVVHEGHLPSHNVSLNFGPIAGIQSVPVSGYWQGKKGPYAIAIAVGGSGAGIVCLRHDLTGLSIQGNLSLTVNNITEPYVFEEGGITINSNDDDYCLYSTGTSIEVNADILNFVASDLTTKGNFVFPPEPETYLNFGQPPMPDPLAWLNEPGNKPTTNPDIDVMDTDLGNVRIVADNKINDYPIPIPAGYYSGGFDLNAGTEENPIRLGAGIYVLGGDGLQVGANAVIVSDPGTFFYITGEGICNIAGGATFTASPMTSGLYENIIIAQDNETLTPADINGGPGFNLKGTMYFPQKLEQKGPKDPDGFSLSLGGSGAAFNNQIITDSLYIYGTGDVVVNYDGRNPAPVSRAYLVE